MKITKELEIEVFEYLDLLRESGQINMFGAASYIRDEFDLDKETSRKLLSSWVTKQK